MSRANVDVESLRKAHAELIAFNDETETFSRTSQHVFDAFEDTIAQFRQELIQKIEEASAQRASGGLGMGGSSELQQMLYEYETGDADVGKLEETLNRLQQLESSYLNERDAFVGELRGLIQEQSSGGVATRGIPSLITLLEDYLG